jgi:hypothetical protein
MDTFESQHCTACGLERRVVYSEPIARGLVVRLGLKVSKPDSPAAPKEESPAISDRASSAPIPVHP